MFELNVEENVEFVYQRARHPLVNMYIKMFSFNDK